MSAKWPTLTPTDYLIDAALASDRGFALMTLAVVYDLHPCTLRRHVAKFRGLGLAIRFDRRTRRWRYAPGERRRLSDIVAAICARSLDRAIIA